MDSDRARKNESIVLERLASVGGEPVAQALGVSESTVTRMKEGDRNRELKDSEVTRGAKLLAALGLKVVPIEYRCVDPKTMDTLLYGHRMWVNSIQDSGQLMWD